MFSLVIHGRGGQGAKSFALLLAKTVIKAGKFAQAFPEYGPERTGAPIKAYLRVDSEEILTHEPIVIANMVVILDDTLLDKKEVVSLVQGNPTLLINTIKSKTEVEQLIKKEKASFRGKVYVINSLDYLVNKKFKVHFSAPIFGRLIKLTNIFSLEDLKGVYEEEFLDKLGDKAIEETLWVMEEAYDDL